MIIHLVTPKNVDPPGLQLKFAYPSKPEKLLIPSRYSEEIEKLDNAGLEFPSTYLALDKAAGITTIIDEVYFDMRASTVSCHFIDGHVEEWPLEDPDCVAKLDSVVEYAKLATDEQKREGERTRWIERQDEKRREEALRKSGDPLLAPPTPTKLKHKKSKSLLTSLMSIFQPPSASAITLPTRSSSPPPPPAPPRDLTSHALLLRARAILMDIYNLYTLRILKQRMPPGGYYTWIARSMLRCVTARMDELLANTNEVPDLVHSLENRGRRKSRKSIRRMQALRRAPSSVSDDETTLDGNAEEDDVDGDTSEVSTDSDDSSLIQTPASTISFSGAIPAKDLAKVTGPGGQQLVISEAVWETYNSLTSQALHLRQLITAVEDARANEKSEMASREIMLEVRSRRRAWLNKTLKRTGEIANGGVGWATPRCRSRLGVYSWVAGDFEEEVLEMNHAKRRLMELDSVRPLTPTKQILGQRASPPRLVSVSEEEEDEETCEIMHVNESGDEEYLLAKEFELGMDMDFDPEEDDDDLLPMDNIPPLTLVKKPSPLRHPLVLDKHGLRIDETLGPLATGPSSGVSSPRYYPQRTKRTYAPPSKRTAPVKVVDVDIEMLEHGVDFDPSGSEFTLAMDLPIRTQSFARVLKSPSPNSRGPKEWFSPPGLPTDCI